MGKIRVIGATTLDEYQKYIEKDAERRSSLVHANSKPSADDTVGNLKAFRKRYEDYRGNHRRSD